MEIDKNQYLEEANKWAEKANEHLRAADFCQSQSERFLGRVAVPDDYKPELTLIITSELE